MFMRYDWLEGEKKKNRTRVWRNLIKRESHIYIYDRGDREREGGEKKEEKYVIIIANYFDFYSFIFFLMSHHQIALLYIILIVVKKNEAEMRK